MAKISEQELNRMAARGATITRAPKPAPAPVQQPPRQPTRAAPAQPPVPMAAMQASMNVINQQLAGVVEQNSRAIDAFRQELAKDKPRPGIPYRHKILRDRSSKLIEYVDSIPMEIKR